MKARKRKEIRQRPAMKMGTSLPLTLPGNPFKGGSKMASAEVALKRGGIGVFFKMKF